MEVTDLCEAVEPVLAYAREALQGDWDPGSLSSLGDALCACRDYLSLYGAPRYVQYDPRAVLTAALEGYADDVMVDAEPVRDCVGDVAQVCACLRLVIRTAMRGSGSGVIVEIFEEGEVPCVAMSGDGPAEIRGDVSLEGLPEVSPDELGARWTLATRGGRVDTAGSGLVFRLKGVRMAPLAVPGIEPLLGRVSEGCERLRSEPDKALVAIEAALDIVDGQSRGKEPGDLNVLWAEAAATSAKDLARKSIRLDSLCVSELPPIEMHRDQIGAFFKGIFRYATQVLPAGGAVTVLIGFDRSRYAVEIDAGLAGSVCAGAGPFCPASFRRCIIERHDGSLEVTTGPERVSIAARLPDKVGRRVDAWIPGFGRFSMRSQRVLRLLERGEGALPAEQLLGDVLEEELERWLLPRLSRAAAVNVAHELVCDAQGLSGGSPARSAKALGQIKRGKARKGIVKPPYAADILWAYRRDERCRKAIGAERLDREAVEALCGHLLAAPPRCVESLRLIARAIEGLETSAQDAG